MENTRHSLRQRRRLRVTLGGSTSFTTNVSHDGFCTEAMRVMAPGTLVAGAICVEGKDYSFAGSVVWARPGDARVNLRGRMGVRFSRVEHAFQRVVEVASPGI